MFRPIHLLVLTCHVDKSLGRDTALVVGHFYLLTECPLGLLDGHALGDADVDMHLLPCRILDTEHLILPVGILVNVHFHRLLYSLGHQRLIIHIDARHKRERLGDDILLRTVVVLEGAVVRTEIGQPVLQGLVAAADIRHHLSQPVLGEQAIHLLPSPALCIPAVIPPWVTRMLRINCNLSYHILFLYSYVLLFFCLNNMLICYSVL